mmetsp:Transcript_7604/g.15812  ORF Transcript_7604/g.15812 Transcript_7604/m.15812 type:complete len:335 (+) Transcript_7604:149-1153(+)
MPSSDADVDMSKPILSILSGSDGRQMDVKVLRKLVLSSLQSEDKRAYKRAVQALEGNGSLELGTDGTAVLTKLGRKASGGKEDRAKRKKEKKEKKKRGPKDADGIEGEVKRLKPAPDEAEAAKLPSTSPSTAAGVSGVCTRLFVGNLPFSVDETSLASHLGPGAVTHVKWLTDRESGKFYGSAFVEMADGAGATGAIAASGSKLDGRPVKVVPSPARPGDVWPPSKGVVRGGERHDGGTTAPKREAKELGPKPDGCYKLFVGNLSYDIDDDGIKKFFDNVGAEMRAVRWIHHKESGDFKGVGFVEFWDTEACEKAAALNGKNLLGRPIRIDWSE